MQALPRNCRNQSLRWKGRSTSGEDREARLPTRSTGTDRSVLCAGQRMNQEGSSPSGARMRGAVSKSGGNSSLAGRARRYGEV